MTKKFFNKLLINTPASVKCFQLTLLLLVMLTNQYAHAQAKYTGTVINNKKEVELEDIMKRMDEMDNKFNRILEILSK